MYCGLFIFFGNIFILAHGSESESDSDTDGHYLHPILLGGGSQKQSRSESPMIGPKTREEVKEKDTPTSVPEIKVNYELGKVS